ncbi:hypothetical protein [Pseudomonas serbica]|jgi:predicted amidophosphoribosyltransferase|uniref:hypothetical protein n=1 Tax=Pseudomonas serbica TaxID=2965074 RepID=UPI00237C4776|nr:hypothetical protein [Pseudomonas serbica]
MATVTCPECKTELRNDPQHCPYCQCGLREPRLNKVGRFVMIAVPTSLVILVIAVVNFFLQVPVLADQTLGEWAILALKCVGSIAAWGAFFWLIGCLEFLCANE